MEFGGHLRFGYLRLHSEWFQHTKKKGLKDIFYHFPWRGVS